MIQFYSCETCIDTWRRQNQHLSHRLSTLTQVTLCGHYANFSSPLTLKHHVPATILPFLILVGKVSKVNFSNVCAYLSALISLHSMPPIINHVSMK